MQVLGWLSLAAAIASGRALKWALDRHPDVARHPAFFGASLLALAALMGGVVAGLWPVFGSGSVHGMFFLAFMALLIAIAWMSYLTECLSAAWVEGQRGWWLSDKRLKAPVSFDRGDAAMKRGEFDLALREYRGELARHPGEPDLFLRMAETHKALKDPAQELACMREAARCAAEPHRRGPILLLLSERLGSPEGGEILGRVLADPTLKAYHEAAKRRVTR